MSAAAYDAWYQTALGAAAHRVELSLVEVLARPHAGERALDAGCGTGIYTAWLAALGLQVTGVDHDPALLTAAAAKAPAAELVQADATVLPFPERTFDLTLAVTLFCFLDRQEREQAARELVRVTRPGGRVVLGELARYSLWAAQRRLKGWRGSRTWKGAHFTTAGELRTCSKAPARTASRAATASTCHPGSYRPLSRARAPSSGSADHSACSGRPSSSSPASARIGSCPQWAQRIHRPLLQ